MLVDMQGSKRTKKGWKSKLLCPSCGGKLSGDKEPFVSDRGFIYRRRTCLSCLALISTKQTKEEVTHVEVKDTDTTKVYGTYNLK